MPLSLTVATEVDGNSRQDDLTFTRPRRQSHQQIRRRPNTPPSSSSPSRSTSGTSSKDERSSATSLDDSSEEDGDSESEGDYLRQRIQHHKQAGRAKPKRTDWTNSLVAREYEHLKAYCCKITADPAQPVDPQQTVRECVPEVIKGYLEWRRKNFRIKEESTLISYWKRIQCKYKDLVGRKIENGTEIEISNWIPTLGLKRTKKEKLAMYVQDFRITHTAHWKLDVKPLHGSVRVSISLDLLLSVATATRPAALVEGVAAKDSNKALWWEHVSLMKVRSKKNRARSTIVALVNLEHIKNAERGARRKKFIFRLESMLGLCIVSHFIAVAFASNVFRRRYNSVEEIFNLEIPPERNVLRLKIKKDRMTQPVFRDIERTPEGIRVSDTEALPYWRVRDHFVWLGKFLGMEIGFELYMMRRGSGRNVNEALTVAERNHTLGQYGDVYDEFYIPDLIERDYQTIYFGTAAEDDLIQSAARIGLSQDMRAPIGLTDAQKEEVRNDPELVKLREKRQRYRERLAAQGYKPIETAKGTKLYDRYDRVDRQAKSLAVKLRRAREE